MADTLKYQLSFDGKTFTNDGQTTVTVGNETFSTSLYGVSFERKIYQPGHIQAELLFTSKEIFNEFVFDMPKLTDWLIDKSVSLSVNGIRVAESYYIHEALPLVEPKYIRDEKRKIPLGRGYIYGKIYVYYIYVKLDIFSPDKKMTLNRFSRAYLGQRLAKDIVENAKDSFCAMSLETGKLFHMAYEEGEGEDKKQIELIHPYLVQYNESFYEFITRIANRCGELCCYDGGKFRIGLPDRQVIEIKNYARVMFQRISDSPLTVRDYTRDSVKGKWEWKDEGTASESFEETIKPGADELITKAIDNNSKQGFPMDAFPRLEKDSKDYAHYYNAEVTSDDQYLLLYRDKFADDSWVTLFFGEKAERLLVWTSDILKSTSLMELISTLSQKLIQGAIKAGVQQGEKNKKGNERLKESVLDNTNDYAVLLAKVDNLSDHWVTLDYYHDIRSKAEEQMRKMVCVDMGEGFRNVQLGDRITIPLYDNSTAYVVVAVEMSSATPWQRSYEGFARETPTLKGVQSQRIYAIPMKDAVFYPPMLPGKPFRQCGPQPAFIVDNGDQTSQGRVRVRYPWQPSLKKEIDAEKAANTAMTDAEKLFKTKWREFLRYAEFYVDIDYSDIKNDASLTDEEKEEKKGERKKVVEANTDLFDWDYKRRDAFQDPKYDTAYDAAESDYITVRDEYRGKTIAWRIAKENLLFAEAATPWIRMVTPMATAEGGGMFFRPEVGDEVMVDYENGNIERPYVVGTLYSKNVRVPDAGSRVIVSRNGHTIKMDDTDDASELAAGFVPGFKVLKSYGADLDFGNLSGDARKLLGGIEMTDKYGFYNIKMSSHNRSISISSPFGDVSVNAFTGISINAPNGDIKITGKNVSITAYNKLSVTSGKNIKASTGGHRNGYVGSMADAKEWGKTVGNFILDMSSAGKFLDLSLLRSIVEIFFRPVDGTLAIKSGRFLTLEAGKGSSSAQPNEYDFRYSDLSDKVRTKLKKTSSEMLFGVVSYLTELVNTNVADYIENYNAVSSVIRELINLPYFGSGIDEPDNVDDLFIDMFRKPAWVDDAALNTEWDRYYKSDNTGTLKLSGQLKFGENAMIQGKVKKMMGCAMKLRKCVEEYPAIDQSKLGGLISVADVSAIMTMDQASPVAGGNELYHDRISEIKDFINNHNLGDGELLTRVLRAEDYRDWVHGVKRRLVHKVVENCRASSNILKGCTIPPAGYGTVYTMNSQGAVSTPVAPQDAVNPFTDGDWAKYVLGIRLLEDENAKMSGLKDFAVGLTDAAAGQLEKLTPWELKAWKSDAPGKILFSDEQNRTYRFNNGATEHYQNPVRALIEEEEKLHTALSNL